MILWSLGTSIFHQPTSIGGQIHQHPLQTLPHANEAKCQVQQAPDTDNYTPFMAVRVYFGAKGLTSVD